MSIVDDDGRRTDDGRTDGRTTDAGPLVYYKLTYEPSAQVSLKYQFTSPGTMVQVMHVLFVFCAVFDNLKSSLSLDNMSVHAIDVFIENATEMV